MKVELELPASLMEFYRRYAKAVNRPVDEVVREVLGDFAFGAEELGFQQ